MRSRRSGASSFRARQLLGGIFALALAWLMAAGAIAAEPVAERRRRHGRRAGEPAAAAQPADDPRPGRAPERRSGARAAAGPARQGWTDESPQAPGETVGLVGELEDGVGEVRALWQRRIAALPDLPGVVPFLLGHLAEGKSTAQLLLTVVAVARDLRRRHRRRAGLQAPERRHALAHPRPSGRELHRAAGLPAATLRLAGARPSGLRHRRRSGLLRPLSRPRGDAPDGHDLSSGDRAAASGGGRIALPAGAARARSAADSVRRPRCAAPAPLDRRGGGDRDLRFPHRRPAGASGPGARDVGCVRHDGRHRLRRGADRHDLAGPAPGRRTDPRRAERPWPDRLAPPAVSGADLAPARDRLRAGDLRDLSGARGASARRPRSASAS